MTWVPAVRASTWRAAAVGLLLMALVEATTTCGGDSGRLPQPEDGETVRGLVYEVSASSLLDLDFLVLEDDAGVTWRFEARGKRYVQFTPSHIRHHMVLGSPLTVTFHREDGHLIADRIED